ncbi:MAG: hypothetical protein VR78_03790 [Hoeflea sp. BRH_c9]|nr:MAG: hypothetical protein VR78_03790 [Hoeflea sp. BRH_c9]
MKKAAILQSAYIPWRGYFDLIASVDEFIFYDDVQFSHGDWRNRNMIRTPSGTKWLTIPVPKKNRIRRNICEVEASDADWATDHWNRLEETYRKAPHFDEISALLKPCYQSRETNLSRINASLIAVICGYLGIKTSISWSWDYETGDGKTQRLVDLCKAVECSTYVSGPAARAYLDEEAFSDAHVTVEWFSYAALRPYPQIHGGFEPAVSIVDLLFNCGQSSRNHIPALAGSS